MTADALLSAAAAFDPAVLLASVAASFDDLKADLWQSFLETCHMVACSTLLSFLLGFVLAIQMILSGSRGLRPRPALYEVLCFLVDTLRSLPFFILLIIIMPVTRFIVGTGIGTTATILPLTVAAAPFAARLIEANLLGVDKGVVEAARSFGAGPGQIILKVMLPEALPAIILNIAVLAIALVGYSAMAGAVGGGGLGDLAYRLGYNRFQTDAAIWCILILLLLVKVIQAAGNWCYNRLR